MSLPKKKIEPRGLSDHVIDIYSLSTSHTSSVYPGLYIIVVIYLSEYLGVGISILNTMLYAFYTVLYAQVQRTIVVNTWSILPSRLDLNIVELSDENIQQI